MHLNFGEHKGKSVELLMLKEPRYVKWILEEKSPYGGVKNAQPHVAYLIQTFDSKPFVGKKCFGKSCGNKATRFTVYQDNLTHIGGVIPAILIR